jgi:hypothetical protein
VTCAAMHVLPPSPAPVFCGLSQLFGGPCDWVGMPSIRLHPARLVQLVLPFARQRFWGVQKCCMARSARLLPLCAAWRSVGRLSWHLWPQIRRLLTEQRRGGSGGCSTQLHKQLLHAFWALRMHCFFL